MKLDYYAETYSLYIDLSERVSVESREISEGVNKLPVTVETIAG